MAERELAYGDPTAATFTPTNLFAGDADIRTNNGTVLSGQDLPQFRVVARNAANKIVTHDPTAVVDVDASGDTANVPAPQAKAIGIMVYACDATSGDTDGQYYTAGDFNHESLGWHASLTTLELRRAVFEGTPIAIKSLAP